jgi:putative ABC transport system ATP-binding protein
MSTVRCIDLCRFFVQGDQTIKALDYVDLEIDEREFVCLSGPSGSGKTTLLNAIGGLDKPTSGEVWVAGQRIDGLGKAELANIRLHHIGFVFQAYNLIPVLTARENVEFVMQVQGIDPAERRERSMSILGEVGLADMVERRPAQLSGGQQQRVAVARAVVSSPAMVLADEPTANLDSVTAAHLMDLFIELNEKHNTTFIISTHDQRVMSYARRLIGMVDGRIATDEVPK